MILSIKTLWIEYHHAESRYCQWQDLFIVLLIVDTMSDVMMNVVMLIVILLNVVAPYRIHQMLRRRNT
jgi:hypothetical protein